MSLKEVKFWYWLVNLLPKKLVYFCIMNTWAQASLIYKDKTPDQITWSMAVKTLEVE